MVVELNGDELIIKMKIDKAGKDSSSGKSIIHATSNGPKSTEVMVNGKPLQISINAYTSKK